MFHSVHQLLERMHDLGATQFYLKKLSPNDNAKNQIYLGGSFRVLNQLPHGPITTDPSQTSNSKRERAKADLNWHWINPEHQHPAPNAQLVLYPKYPEVRLSGLITGCKASPKQVITVRDEGRLLFMGIHPQGHILAHACLVNCPLAQEVHALEISPQHGVLIELHRQSQNTRHLLLDALRAIHQQGWVPSQKLNSQGQTQPYSARNGGGYTLEALLGIAPNGTAEPDYLGWEVKQFAVNNFSKNTPKSPVTLFTPEPTAGLYKEQGLIEFMRQFGYPDKNGQANRINFGGRYKTQSPANRNTGLRLHLAGFDPERNAITDFAQGGIELLTATEEVAAKWTFAQLLEHWNRKHAKAVYVPSMQHNNPSPAYQYGAQVLLCEGTDFSLFLRSVAQGHVYYDPAIKLEGDPDHSPTLKRRSQFRTRHLHLQALYNHTEWVGLG